MNSQKLCVIQSIVKSGLTNFKREDRMTMEAVYFNETSLSNLLKNEIDFKWGCNTACIR